MPQYHRDPDRFYREHAAREPSSVAAPTAVADRPSSSGHSYHDDPAFTRLFSSSTDSYGPPARRPETKYDDAHLFDSSPMPLVAPARHSSHRSSRRAPPPEMVHAPAASQLVVHDRDPSPPPVTPRLLRRQSSLDTFELDAHRRAQARDGYTRYSDYYDEAEDDDLAYGSEPEPFVPGSFTVSESDSDQSYYFPSSEEEPEKEEVRDEYQSRRSSSDPARTQALPVDVPPTRSSRRSRQEPSESRSRRSSTRPKPRDRSVPPPVPEKIPLGDRPRTVFPRKRVSTSVLKKMGYPFEVMVHIPPISSRVDHQLTFQPHHVIVLHELSDPEIKTVVFRSDYEHQKKAGQTAMQKVQPTKSTSRRQHPNVLISPFRNEQSGPVINFTPSRPQRSGSRQEHHTNMELMVPNRVNAPIVPRRRRRLSSPIRPALHAVEDVILPNPNLSLVGPDSLANRHQWQQQQAQRFDLQIRQLELEKEKLEPAEPVAIYNSKGKSLSDCKSPTRPGKLVSDYAARAFNMLLHTIT